MRVWVVRGMTESGDDWCLVFRSEPSPEKIAKTISNDEWLSSEYELGCIQGWSVEELEVLE